MRASLQHGYQLSPHAAGCNPQIARAAHNLRNEPHLRQDGHVGPASAKETLNLFLSP
jgi:hypothetical protein